MKRFVLEGGHAEFDEGKGAMLSLVYDGVSFIAKPIPFFALRLRGHDGKHHDVDASSFSYKGEEGGYFHYEGEEADVDLKIVGEKGALEAFIRVKNKTDLLLEWVEWGSLGVEEGLEDDPGGKGQILYSYNEGAVVTSLKRREGCVFRSADPDYPSKGTNAIFPNMLCAQFMAYQRGEAGLYLAMEDEERGTKNIDFAPGKGCLRLYFRSYGGLDYGEGYAPKFPFKLRPYRGDFYDACSFYRAWFEKHLPAKAMKLKDRAGVPSWYLDSPIVCIYPVRGTHDTGEMPPNRLFPYENALPFLREVKAKTDSPVMALLMHCEGSAPWAPPYLYPPYGGEKMFSSFLQKCHEEGILVGMYASGFGYTLKSKTDPSYDKRDEFARKDLARYMASDSDGRLASVTCTPQRVGYDLCPACSWSQEVVASEVQKMIDLGVDYLQALDQNHGGTGYFCYSDKHGHAPGPGAWEKEATLKTLDKIRAGKALIGCESGAAEPYVGALLFSDCRYVLNYYVGKPFPLYSYLFHEYLHNFMGNQVCDTFLEDDESYPLRSAYSFLAGDILAVDLTDEGKISAAWGLPWDSRLVEKKTAMTILKNLNAWRRGALKEVFNYGRMERPLPVKSGVNILHDENGVPLCFPAVMSASYSLNGVRWSILANATAKAQEASWEGEMLLQKDPLGKLKLEKASSVLIPPYSALALRPLNDK